MNFDVSRLKDPLFFAENRVAAHSDHVAYASMEELSHGETSLRCSLNGLWKFHHALNAGQVIPGFEAADYDSRGWADIHVPAHIQMEGYGAPQYANVQYPWDGYQAVEIGEIPQEYNPVASYIKTFFVPTQMVGKRVFISFQGAESCIAVWLNGRYVGFSSDSFTPSEFELTDYLVEGENKLACRVERWSAGSWLEDQDFMRFSGIFRDVYLYAIPKAHITDIRVKTLLDDSFTDATLDLAMKMELDAAVGACRVKMALLDGGEVIAAAERVAEGGLRLLDHVPFPLEAERRAFAAACHPAYARHFPAALEELEGLAAGQNCRQEDLETVLFTTYALPPACGCSCLAVSNGNGVFFGRNSDFLTALEPDYTHVTYGFSDRAIPFTGNTTSFVQMEDAVNARGLGV